MLLSPHFVLVVTDEDDFSTSDRSIFSDGSSITIIGASGFFRGLAEVFVDLG